MSGAANLERLGEPCVQYLAGMARCRVAPTWIGPAGPVCHLHKRPGSGDRPMSPGERARQRRGREYGGALLERAVLVVAVLAVAVFGGNLARSAVDLGDRAPVPVVCEEDQPCWDCSTMGNRRCGPGSRVGG